MIPLAVQAESGIRDLMSSGEQVRSLRVVRKIQNLFGIPGVTGQVTTPGSWTNKPN
jgi:hypothetical protein